MKISHLTIESPVFAAPMAGFSTRAFREILREKGIGLAYGEMVSAQALCHGNKRTRELLDFVDEPGLHVVQLFASNPGYMAEGACIARELGAHIIDINMGCPMPKVVNNGEGAALMRNPQLAARLVEAARRCGLPVTVKMRSGFNEAELNAPELAQHLEAAGAALVAVHGRHREQYYTGRADWRQIALVKQAVSIPVAGNGDVFSVADALAMREQTGCDAVMLGRGILGNPWLAGHIAAAFAEKQSDETAKIQDNIICPRSGHHNSTFYILHSTFGQRSAEGASALAAVLRSAEGASALAVVLRSKSQLGRSKSQLGRSSPQQVLDTALAHLRRQVERSIYWQELREPGPPQQTRLLGELAAVRSMRAHLGHYVKGMPGAARLRAQINQLTRVEEIERLFAGYLAVDQE